MAAWSKDGQARVARTVCARTLPPDSHRGTVSVQDTGQALAAARAMPMPTGNMAGTGAMGADLLHRVCVGTEPPPLPGA